MKILVVDDDPHMREALTISLELHWDDATILAAKDGEEGLRLFVEHDPDVVLLDVSMPGKDGFLVLAEIRQRSDVPVLMLTARGDETAQVRGLELGADDYVVKPFSAPEVVARVRTHLRRLQGAPAKEPPLRAGKVELDLEARRCTVDGRQVDLPRRQFDLLTTLMQAPGRVFTREQLLEHAWGTPYLSPKTVDVHVARLRAGLGDAVQIVALRGVGYRLEG
jgi:DNA-binding response OmpR family regulator